MKANSLKQRCLALWVLCVGFHGIARERSIPALLRIQKVMNMSYKSLPLISYFLYRENKPQ